ncbi:MAG: PD-(D/E)XK nuclease family protein, partial [Cyanobacteria bacterium P01_E01_bin.35]
AEIRGVLTQVKVLLTQEIAPQDIVLVTRDEQLYGTALIDLAWEYNLPIQVSYEIPLEQTRLGAWLKLLLEVIRDNFPFEATAKLLSHPLSNSMTEEIWSSARQIHPQGLIAWQKLGVDLSLLDWHSSQERSVWIDRLLQILSDWDILENAKSWAREIVAYYRLQEGLRELAKPPTQQLTKSAFSTEIQEILALLTIPAQPGRGGIKLHSPTSLRGTNYPYVFVLGTAEGLLPAEIADERILDFHDRKQLVKQGFKLKTAVDLAQQETFDFYCLLNVPTENIVFSYPELIAQNTILPSPYLSRLGLKPTPVNNLPVTSIEQARQLYLRQPDLLSTTAHSLLSISEITHQWQVETQRESAITPDQYDGIIGISIDPQSKIFSASQLTQLGQCPFKWFSARLLKLKELKEAESDLSAAVRGVLYHRCLELSLSAIKTASDLIKFDQQQLAQAFTIAEQELKLTELPGWSAQRQEHLDLLTLNLSSKEFLSDEREVIATETKFNMQWHGLQIQGKVDRIDRTPTGLTVIDYKTSGTIPAGVKDDTGKANLDVQLAVYQDAIAEQYPDQVIDTTAYYSLTQRKTISRPQKNPADLAAFAEKVKSHLEQGHYPVAPDIDRKACRYCDYDLVCRQGDRLSRKNSSLE